MRKPIRWITVGLLLIATSCSQHSDPPEVVKTAFKQKFPDTQEVRWETEDASSWEAEFELNSIAYSSNFNLQGNWLETEHLIKSTDIPPSIQTVLDKDFPDFALNEVEISERPTGVFYECDIEKAKEEWELVFDRNGKLLEKKNNGQG